MSYKLNMDGKCGYSLYWHGCYRGSHDLIHPDSFAHPAKMSPVLCFRILEHLRELKLLKEGDTILDPMAGTGMTNICAGAMGYKSISVELEEKFIGFEKQNKEYAERRLYKDLDWQIIQGDSRWLSELLSEKGLISVTSPPYNKSLDRWVGDKQNQLMKDKKLHAMPKSEKGLVSVLSPPFYQSGKEPNDGTIGVRGRDFARNRYGTTEGQIGNLPDTPLKAITSPPYGEQMQADKSGIDWSKGKGGRDKSKEPAYNPDANYITSDLRYSRDPANLGNLPDKPLKSVMSPPYEESTNSDNPDKRGGLYRDQKRRSDKTLTATYGEAEGQVGCEKGESYLSAMLQVYKEIARVSDVLVVVIKNPTRNGKLRRLDLDTIKIMQMAGWNIHCQHRALLFEELEQPDLFGGKQKQVKGRLSFFKRLSWQKGQPVASWEDVIVAIRQIVLIGDRDTRSKGGYYVGNNE